MSFFAILCALLIEQARPLKDANFLHTQVRSALSWAVRQLDTGQDSHARLTWWVVVLVPAVMTAGPRSIGKAGKAVLAEGAKAVIGSDAIAWLD
jgi:hypothetical protein